MDQLLLAISQNDAISFSQLAARNDLSQPCDEVRPSFQQHAISIWSLVRATIRIQSPIRTNHYMDWCRIKEPRLW